MKSKGRGGEVKCDAVRELVRVRRRSRAATAVVAVVAAAAVQGKANAGC